jgi:hypothetical protein
MLPSLPVEIDVLNQFPEQQPERRPRAALEGQAALGAAEKAAALRA